MSVVFPFWTEGLIASQIVKLYELKVKKTESINITIGLFFSSSWNKVVQ